MTRRDSATRSSLNAMWSMVRRPWKPRPAVAINRFGPRADWSAARRRSAVALRCPIRWLKSPTMTRRSLWEPVSAIGQGQPDTPRGLATFSGSRVDPLANVDQGMQTPITVTSPTPVWVTPETNRPGGSDSWPTSATGLPGRSGPQQDLPSALLTLSEGLTPVGLGADGVAILRQGQTRGVRLGETDDVRNVLGNAALQLRPLSIWPFGPFDIPVEQFQRHRASSPRAARC